MGSSIKKRLAPLQKRRNCNKAVDLEIEPNFSPIVRIKKHAKFIIMGTMFTGKSTFFKQFKRIYEREPNFEECKCYRASIYSNLILFVKTVCEEILLYPKSVDVESQEFIGEILFMEQEMFLNIEKIFDETFSKRILKLMNDPVFAHVANTSKYLLQFDNAAFLYQNRERIAKTDYQPTHNDTILCRIKTTGISQYSISFPNLPQLGLRNSGDFDIYDAGGARNERKKWIFMFSKLSCMFYCASLMDFTRVCYEDGLTNRLTESLIVFEEIANSITLIETPLVILFSGVDLLRSLIKVDPVIVEKYFGTTNFGEICQQVKEMFMQKIEHRSNVYTFFLDMTDSNIISQMMECIYGIQPYCVFQDSRHVYVPKNMINERSMQNKDFYDVYVKCQH